VSSISTVFALNAPTDSSCINKSVSHTQKAVSDTAEKIVLFARPTMPWEMDNASDGIEKIYLCLEMMKNTISLSHLSMSDSQSTTLTTFLQQANLEIITSVQLSMLHTKNHSCQEQLTFKEEDGELSSQTTINSLEFLSMTNLLPSMRSNWKLSKETTSKSSN